MGIHAAHGDDFFGHSWDAESGQSLDVGQPESIDDTGYYTEAYPGPVADSLGTAPTQFGQRWEALQRSGLPPWAPFGDMDEWEFANWLINRVNKTGIDEFLKLQIVSPKVTLSATDHHCLIIL